MAAEDRLDLFELIAEESMLPSAVIEKDFWVCYILNHLFHQSEYQKQIVFKGGTSLSKAYNLINRFSEDIDLVIDWRLLGYGIHEPWEERSNTKQEEFRQETIIRTNNFLIEEFAPKLQSFISDDLGETAKVYPALEDETIVFEYPRLFEFGATLDVIRLEVGPLAAWTPTETVLVKPYAAEYRPLFFENTDTEIVTVKPERTFWEKATILHQEAYRAENKSMPRRYSHHYYDLYQLGHSYVKNRAFTDLDLLKRVVAFKDRFYRTPWSQIDKATPGSFKLMLPEYRLPEIKQDYKAMQAMLFGERPSFDEITDYLAKLEKEINDL
jgi:predicted nucleotidyltransferase component of viral defense system